jgi:hypothetical protein
MHLGLGCGTLGSNVTYQDSCALVESAYDSGFRHFDVAPPYGDGYAEGILGDVLLSVRDSVTITTKAGLPRPQGASPLRAIRRSLLPLRRRFPALWGGAASIRHRAPLMPQGVFDVDDIVASVEESLTSLRTDHVDFLLLHEVQPPDITDELLEALAHLRTDGRLRSIGLGTSVEASVQILRERPACLDMIQVSHYWGAFGPTLAGEHLVLTHGCIRAGLGIIESPEFRRVAMAAGSLAELNRLLSDPRKAPELLIAAGVEACPGGMVLVSSSNPARLRHLAEVAKSDQFGPLVAQLNGCFQQVAGALP